MLLVIDIGNTNTNLGVFDNSELLNVFSISSDKLKTSDEYGILICAVLEANNLKNKIKSACLSSVVPNLGETISKAVKNYLNIDLYKVSHKSKLPFKIAIDNPKEAGADRLANASAACMMYKLPAIVIDIGTATTFDIIDENKNFIGGIIAPGPYIQALSLSKFTSKLPKLQLEAPKSAIGRNTIDAMLSGIVTGHEKMVEGMIELCEKELNQKSTIIATGGFSNIMFKNISRPIDFCKDLTLFGLKNIYELNCGEKL